MHQGPGGRLHTNLCELREITLLFSVQYSNVENRKIGPKWRRGNHD